MFCAHNNLCGSFFLIISLKRRAFTACTSSCCENLNFLLFRSLIIKACKCSFHG